MVDNNSPFGASMQVCLFAFALLSVGASSFSNPHESVESKLEDFYSSKFTCDDFASDGCQDLPFSCITCRLNDSCVYGRNTSGNCSALTNVKCKGDRDFVKPFICRYCFLTPKELHTCTIQKICKVFSNPKQKMVVNCTVDEQVVCLGQRTFLKSLPCNWTSGYRWSTALLLSITLGGFGADRFYLGHWKEGIGKLFSFGGLGVWTLVDIILVAVGYISPHDGSLYIF